MMATKLWLNLENNEDENWIVSNVKVQLYSHNGNGY